ncbi:MAG: hypothetical protein JWN76_826 [Chitinophagaceae bacterium]|nr:hypothetical protein [Chitinophagaceae bacterium]
MKKLAMTGILVCVLGMAKAQSFSGTITPDVTIPAFTNVIISSTTSATVPFSTTNDYLNGITVLNFNSFQVRCNKSWQFTIQTTTANFTGGTSTIPASIVGVRLNGGNSFYPLSTTVLILKSGTLGDVTATGHSFSIDVSANPGFNYNGGTYSIGLQYTLTAQ